jgi:hypothetical protein
MVRDNVLVQNSERGLPGIQQLLDDYPSIGEDYQRLVDYLELSPYLGYAFDPIADDILCYPIYSPEGADSPAAVLVYRVEERFHTVFVYISAVYAATHWLSVRDEAIQTARSET